MSAVADVEVIAPADETILTPEALDFVARLHRELNPRRLELLARRQERQAELDAGALPGFLPETKGIREGGWSVAPAPADLRDRRCEITGPVERKMMINALNSGARVFMADYEDANSPTWTNVIEGQRNVSDAVRRTISLETPEKRYVLNDEIATLLIRPRGWHLPERHVLVDGQPISASLFDFGLHMFRNAREQCDRGSGPYFYLPKLESHHEARLWAQAFELAEEELGLRARDDPLHRPDRDDPRRLRDGGDPPRAARLGLRPQRRPLGLHVQRDQEVPLARGLGAPRPDPGDDDGALHARLHGAARPLLPPPRRPRDRRHGRVHPVAQGSRR